MKIERLVIDSTDCVTDLCRLGVKHPTDKSPYNESASLHKHPYTAVYNMLFSNIRYNNINFGEVGILDNMSTKCWREYFPNATLYGYEYSDVRLHQAISDKLSNVEYCKMDVTDEASIRSGLDKKMFDVLIDDSTHVFDDQIRFAKIAYKHIKPGGFLIIEDVFRDEREERYAEELQEIAPYFSSMVFIVTEHKLRHSPGWNNDKLLILNRNNVS